MKKEETPTRFYHTLHKFDKVVAFRGLMEDPPNCRMQCIDRGHLFIQKREDPVNQGIFCRLLLFPRGTEMMPHNLDQAIVIPLSTIKRGYKNILTDEDFRIGEFILELHTFIDTRFDGHERFYVWLDVKGMKKAVKVIAELMNEQFNGGNEENKDPTA